MKIFVTGTRGIPGIPGGVEAHCSHLYPIITSLGHNVCVSRRTKYFPKKLRCWKGIELMDIYSPRGKKSEAIVHTFLSILMAKKWSADLLHVHAIGPGLLIPFAKLLGMKVIFTNHGPDYDRQKWGKLAKRILRLGEYLGCKYADEVIAITPTIQTIVKTRTGRKNTVIYNGVDIPTCRKETDYLLELDVTPGRYILTVARLVPEKGLHDLLEAFGSIEISHKLVIAGAADHDSAYSRNLKLNAGANPDIVMPGSVTGSRLAQLYANASLFVLPSYHEGFSISLLEALSYGLPVLVSDIDANKEVGLKVEDYFTAGETKELADLICRKVNKPYSEYQSKEVIDWVTNKYNWSRIAEKTIEVYKKTGQA